MWELTNKFWLLCAAVNICWGGTDDVLQQTYIVN